MSRCAIIPALVLLAAAPAGAGVPDAWVSDADRAVLIGVERLSDALATTRDLALVDTDGRPVLGVEGIDTVEGGGLILVVDTDAGAVLARVDMRPGPGESSAVVESISTVSLDLGERPRGVAFDRSTRGGAILISTGSGSRVVRVSSGGRVAGSGVIESDLGEPIAGAVDLAFDPAGGLAVLDARARAVWLFDPGARRARKRLPLESLGPAALDAIAWDPDRGVWLVGQSRIGRLAVLDPAGKLERFVRLPDAEGGRLSALALARRPRAISRTPGGSFDFAAAAGLVSSAPTAGAGGSAGGSGGGGRTPGPPRVPRGDGPPPVDPPADDPPGDGPPPLPPLPPTIPPPGPPPPTPWPPGDPTPESPFGFPPPVVTPAPGAGLGGGAMLAALAARRRRRRV
ncbi:MAG: hypothetical protein D6693_07150 [Planctomycetota bacterium]|nr:MAG: hypothetical protein D6693_07150 [Planctomycetota bacterium]